jgi:5-methylcytosine-specific restriction endonuclease McrA
MANSEYRKYHASTKMKKERAQRNRNRRVMERAGLVKKGDGREVDHKKPMSKGGGNGRKNLRVVSRSVNRKKHNKTGK